MSFFSDISANVSAIRALTGEVSDVALLPTAAARLDDAGAVQLLELASAVGQMAERLRVAAAGVVAIRSSRAAGHAGLAQSQGHRSAVTLVQHVTGMSRGEAAKQVRVGESLYDTGAAETRTPSIGVPVDSEGSAESLPADAADAGIGDAGSGHAGAGDAVAGDAVAGHAGAGDAGRATETGVDPIAASPWHAPLGSALLNGAITAAQHDAILRGLGQPPQRDCPRETSGFAAAWSVATEQLIEETPRRTVEELGKAARYLRDQLDPEGAEERYLARYEARSFRMWADADGRLRASVTFDDFSGAWVRSAFDAALRPRRGGPRFVKPAEQAKAAALTSDPRSNEQLAFDLMVDLLRAGSLADAETVYGTRQAGVRLVQVVREADDAAPVTSGPAHTEDGVLALPPWVAQQQACTVGTVQASVSRDGNPLYLGRSVRLFTPAQRIALAIRDGGCRWSECDRPASSCEAHHIDSWASQGGRTDIDRGILLCAFHHMQLHNGGWRITRAETEDFVLHDPGGGSTPLPPRIELRYAWAGIDPPPRRFTLAA